MVNDRVLLKFVQVVVLAALSTKCWPKQLECNKFNLKPFTNLTDIIKILGNTNEVVAIQLFQTQFIIKIHT